MILWSAIRVSWKRNSYHEEIFKVPSSKPILSSHFSFIQANVFDTKLSWKDQGRELNQKRLLKCRIVAKVILALILYLVFPLGYQFWWPCGEEEWCRKKTYCEVPTNKVECKTLKEESISTAEVVARSTIEEERPNCRIYSMLFPCKTLERHQTGTGRLSGKQSWLTAGTDVITSLCIRLARPLWSV
jgi:hypothetical protein